MANTNTTLDTSQREAAPEQACVRRCMEKMTEIDQALRREAAALRGWARSLEESNVPLADQMHQGAIRIDALAWEVRSFDPDDAAGGHSGLAARAGSIPTEHQRDSGSGEGTRTDLGDGPGGTDTKGTGVTD